MSVFANLLESGRGWGGRPAIIDQAGALGYQALWDQITGVRDQLLSLGVGAGHGVGVRGGNGRAFIIGTLAASACGATVMPVPRQSKPAEITDLLAQAPLSFLLEEKPTRLAHEQTSDPLGLAGLTFTKLRSPAGPLAPGFADAAFVRFSSGTTGRAKGVVLTHRAVLERIQAANQELRLTCEDRVLCVLPMAYHFYVSILLYLQVGATIIILPDSLAGSILDAAWQHAATFLYLTPLQVRLLAADDSRRLLPPAVKRVMSVSSRLEPDSAAAFLARFQLPVSQGYGVIELGLPIMNLSEAAEHPEAIGRPVPGIEAAILNDDLRPVARGQTGQLGLRGPGMFAGYLSPRTPRDEILREGWFLTGDLAHQDAAGRFVIDGRATSVIHTAGLKVFPEEVAAVLDHYPGVMRSRVSGRPHPQLGEALHAEIQLHDPAARPTVESLLQHCRRQLSSHKVPASIEFVDRMELTPSEKVRHGSPGCAEGRNDTRRTGPTSR